MRHGDQHAQILVLAKQDPFFQQCSLLPALHWASDLEDVRDVEDTVQGIFQIVPKKLSGDCDTNEDMELTLAGFCSVLGELKSKIRSLKPSVDTPAVPGR